MSLKAHFEAELDFAKLDEKTRAILLACYQVWNNQGHSGGSASCLIGFMRHWLKDLIPITDSRSLLVDISRILFTEIADSYEREVVLSYLIKLLNFEPLTPLTGNDDEWVQHDWGSSQNKRCGSLFKSEDGEVTYLNGRTFYRPSSTGGDLIGYGNYYSSVEVTFPWSIPAAPEKHFYLDTNATVEIDPAHAAAFSEIATLKHGAGFVNGDYIRKASFFIDPIHCEGLKKVFTDVISRMGQFDAGNRAEVISTLANATWTDEYESDCEVIPVPGLFEGMSIHRALLYPLMRLIALIPNDAKLVDGELNWFRGTKLQVHFAIPMFPTRLFMDWQRDDKSFSGKLVVSLEKDRNSPPEFLYFDRVGYEIKYVADDDGYLYDMRRKFGIAHPKRKNVKAFVEEKDSEE